MDTAVLTEPSNIKSPPISGNRERIVDLIRFTHRLVTPPMSFEQFLEIGKMFPELRLEQERNGQITIMPPVFFGTGTRESEANGLLWLWNRQAGLGRTISASGGIRLPDGSTKQADTAWISNQRLSDFDALQLDGSFLPIAPDFIIEIRSKTDDIEGLTAKMKDSWIANGVRLAWLIDPYQETARIYRANGTETIIEGFEHKMLSGEDVLPGFTLELKDFRIGN
jgi:Uma2 family endonuclease